MNQSLNWRIGLNLMVILICTLVVLPNFVNFSKDNFMSKSKIKYGLDIQGGSHLVLGVDVDEVLTQSMARLGEGMVGALKSENVHVKSIQPLPTNKMHLEVLLNKSEDLPATKAFIEKNYPNLTIAEASGDRLVLHSVDVYTDETKRETVSQAIETIRNRIDQFGVAEPSITAQGLDRILVQLPGIEDAAGAKDLINRTARLEFMMVEPSTMDLTQLIADAEKEGIKLGEGGLKYTEYVKKLNEKVASKLPPKTKILFAKSENVENLDMGKVPYLLRTDTDLGGGALRDATIRLGEFNEPEVSLSFNPLGAQKFAELTGNNIGKQMAIVLDDMVYSAPNIQTKIPDGNARITLGGGRNRDAMMNEAKTVSMALKAGALPARLEQLEERTVGPSLGADSIAAGVKASWIAAILIFVFMLIYYKAFGMIANIALGFNVLMILAGLTMIGATLTLPGIAGIALTLGIAIDANVIINERIKEELATGASFAAAIRDGYAKAFSAIFDSNLTAIATSAILIYFGSGPIRGFGVTLIVGLVTSLFTSIFFTRTLVETLIYRFKIQKISI
ncbi:MAG: protein translocase subunit SecD [Bdellovibrionales bacterium]